MKNSQKGFIVLLLTVIVAVLVIGGGVYFYRRSSSAPRPIKYQMVSTANAQYSYPLITDYPNKAVMDKVNKTLTEAFKDFGCDPETPKDKFEWNVKIGIDYAQNGIFSVNASGNYYCGGPYPTNDYSSTLTFNMKTGEQITFEKLFQNYEKDKEQIINTIYSEVIAKTNDYVAKHPTDDDNCENINTSESLSDYSQDYRLSSTTKTIYIRPDYPHVIEACIEKVEVPIQKLLPFIDRNSILNRI